ILVGVVTFVITSVIIIGAIMGTSATSFGTGASYAASAVAAVLGTAISMGYFAFMESSRGQTVGKMLMKLKTVGPTGGNPTLVEAVKRNSYIALGLLGLIPVIGWIASLASVVAVIMIAVGINKDTVNRQGWHDHFAGETRVLKIG
ncbi:MAG: RDD family protein, partial [Nocardioides sp.]